MSETELIDVFKDRKWTSTKIDVQLEEMRKMHVTNAEKKIFEDAGLAVPESVKNAEQAALTLKNLYARGLLKGPEERRSRLKTKKRKLDGGASDVASGSTTFEAHPSQESQSIDGPIEGSQ